MLAFPGARAAARRLIRRGLAPASAVGAALWVDLARAAEPKAIAEETVRLAVRALGDSMTAGGVSASVRMLVKGVLKTMLLSKLRTTAIAVFAMVFLAAGLGAVAWVVAKDSNPAGDDGARPAFAQQPRRTSSPIKERGETWSLALREAIYIGLDNSEVVRVISVGRYETPCTIVPQNPGVNAQRFKAEVMAQVRSIEQQYWNLSQAHVHLSSAEKAVELAKGVLDGELRAKGKATAADVAAAAQRLEQLKLELVTRTSDLITTERPLRNILGLPPTDGRRITPVTAPTEARLEPDWDECLAVMLEKQPDVVRARAIMKQAEADAGGDGSARLERQKALFEQVIHQTTHSLARFFLKIDANYKQFRTASKRRSAAAQRLEAQRADYEEGTITVERYLDAVSQHAAAVATEAQYLATYNIALVALEEAKGTLLEHEQITVAERPKPVVSGFALPDVAVKPGWHLAAVPDPEPTPGRAADFSSDPREPAASHPRRPRRQRTAGEGSEPENRPRGKTYSFQVTIGIGSKPVEIRSSFTITPAPSGDGPKVD